MIYKEQCAVLSGQDSKNWAYFSKLTKMHFSTNDQWWTAEKPTDTLTMYYNRVTYILSIKEEVLYVLRNRNTISKHSRGTKANHHRFSKSTKIPFSLLEGMFRHFFFDNPVEHTYMSNAQCYLYNLWATELIFGPKPSSFGVSSLTTVENWLLTILSNGRREDAQARFG